MGAIVKKIAINIRNIYVFILLLFLIFLTSCVGNQPDFLIKNSSKYELKIEIIREESVSVAHLNGINLVVCRKLGDDNKEDMYMKQNLGSIKTLFYADTMKDYHNLANYLDSINELNTELEQKLTELQMDYLDSINEFYSPQKVNITKTKEGNDLQDSQIVISYHRNKGLTFVNKMIITDNVITLYLPPGSIFKSHRKGMLSERGHPYNASFPVLFGGKVKVYYKNILLYSISEKNMKECMEEKEKASEIWGRGSYLLEVTDEYVNCHTGEASKDNHHN